MSLVPDGGGSLAVVLRNEFRIHAPGDVGIVRLPAGTALVRQIEVDDLQGAVCQHLHGPVLGSELRLGVSLFLGREGVEEDFGPYADRVRGEINAWLGAQTNFVFWPDVMKMPESPKGFFAGVVRSWALVHLPRMALH
ncbi:MAG: hypothetical protein KF910_08660 [Brevundimonas sp.]|uniref:hypothetical protein n=1 Tax=Brevundimonas sp. TaxID=1871086 RepID=UPI0025C45636|nr:hypothetical protein [Brevundimonas sp.]MBX3477665.1 hypothetical protein [Brevundimonas sp.]